MISRDDEHAIRELARQWDVAWKSHDMALLASLVTPGIDFIHADGHWLGGRDVFQKYHADLHAGPYKHSVHHMHGVVLRPLSPDICLAHMNWTISGGTAPGGEPARTRQGISGWVVRRLDGTWLIDAAQDTLRRSATIAVDRNLDDTPQDANSGVGGDSNRPPPPARDRP